MRPGAGEGRRCGGTKAPKSETPACHGLGYQILVKTPRCVGYRTGFPPVGDFLGAGRGAGRGQGVAFGDQIADCFKAFISEICMEVLMGEIHGILSLY